MALPLSFGVGSRLGLFKSLTGGIAWVLRRYAGCSTPGTLLVGGLTATLVGSLFFTGAPAPPGAESPDASARVAYVERLPERVMEEDVHVGAREPGRALVWFYAPAAAEDERGDVSESATLRPRAHSPGT